MQVHANGKGNASIPTDWLVAYSSQWWEIVYFLKARPQLYTFPGLEFTLVSKNSVSPQILPKVVIWDYEKFRNDFISGIINAKIDTHGKPHCLVA